MQLLYELDVVELFTVGEQGHVLRHTREVVGHFVEENRAALHLLVLRTNFQAFFQRDVHFVFLYLADAV